ncbi:MAG: FkbM family methyltransferase [Candidatus Pacebacteria bacterium CG10_big_fil_rev_8_21_14_0_10_44_54]|nr:MAG: FkbM family methyltransferase [Candidatus Pacebacteria bacterium CG10_big_fil_rev_8_21_14_0_10_44_54]
MIKKIALRLLRQTNLIALYELKKSSYLSENGWFNSFATKQSISADGQPLPWMTYPLVDFIIPRISNNLSVAEYGSGGSTIWWASKVKDVFAVEGDKFWYRKISKNLPINATIHFQSSLHKDKYAGAIIKSNKKYDIIVIDGRHRVRCSFVAVKQLTSGGVIIWDNTERKEYQTGIDLLKRSGFKQIQFVGMSPINTYKSETSVFYKKNNCLII